MSTTPTPDTPGTTDSDTNPIHATDIPETYTPDEIHVTNIGGITETTIPVTPGLNILTGENATNRTSLLTALNSVLGGTQATMRANTDHAHVHLTFTNNDTDNPDDRITFNRQYKRTGKHTQSLTTNNPFHNNKTLVDTFVTLLETNPIRKAVENSDNNALREHLTSPIDTNHIERQIRDLQTERDNLQTRKKQLEHDIENEPELITKQTELENEIEDLETEIEELNQEIEAHNADVELAEEAEDLVDELENKRSTANDTRNDIQVLNAELEAVENEIEDLETEHVELPEPTTNTTISDADGDEDADADALIQAQQQEIEVLQNRKNDLERIVNDLNRVTSFTDKFIDDSDDLPGLSSDTADVTDELNPDAKHITCWTCGSNVPRSTITDQMNELRDIATEHSNELNTVKNELETARNTLREIKNTVTERERITTRLTELTTEKQSIETNIEAKQTELDDLETEIEELQEEVENTKDLRDTDLPETYDELTQKEYALGEKQNAYETVTEQLAELESKRSELDTVETELETVRDSLTDLRGKVDEIEERVVSEFNEHMETILTELEYENIERVWIERRKPDTSRRGASTQDSEFILHIVRDTDDGVIEDRVENLSESERETIGLIAALTGYLVHDVHEHIPFMLLDSVEAVDSERLVKLVEYFADHATILFVALLPEDSAVFPDSYTRITQEAL